MAWFGAVVLSLALALPGAAAAVDVPDDVVAVMDCEAADRSGMLDEACGKGSFSALRAVHAWSPEFLAGREGAVVAEPQEWIAVRFDADGVILGTATAWQPTEAEYELAGYDNGVALGELVLMFIEGAPPDALLVHDPPSGAWYMVAGDSVSPLNDWALQIVAEAMPLAEARSLISAEHLAGIEACGGDPTCAGGGGGGDTGVVELASDGPQLSVVLGTTGAIVGALVLALGVTAVALRRRAA